MSNTSNIDDSGNSVIVWTGTAGDLLAARDTLAGQRSLAEDKARSVSLPRKLTPEERSYWIEVMLTGFAVENLLKAFWLARGNRMYRQGRLQKFSGVKNHDLIGIANAVGFAIKDPERKDLAMLSEIMAGRGRYPLATCPQITESWGSDSASTIQKLVRRLRESIRDAKKA